ncbi:MAG: hypothetical protein IPL65_21505 [Lewinellaceae bacterium]|nr:hypothetical protein [Lewinellaceae bacterium]
MRVLFVLLLLSARGLCAQSDTLAHPGPLVPKLTFKTNIISLINPLKEAVAFASDVRLGPKASIDLGVGAFLGSSVLARTQGESYQGLRLRTGFKYYGITSKRYVFHFGAEGKYNNIRHVSLEQVLRQGGQYLEILPIERHVRALGIGGRCGWQFFAGKKKQVFFEPYLYLGALYYQVSRDLPADATEFLDWEFINFEIAPGRSRFPDFTIGFHFGMALWNGALPL